MNGNHNGNRWCAMKFSLKKCGIAACLAVALILAWINLRPVEVVAVHQDDQLTYILVRDSSTWPIRAVLHHILGFR